MFRSPLIIIDNDFVTGDQVVVLEKRPVIRSNHTKIFSERSFFRSLLFPLVHKAINFAMMFVPVTKASRIMAIKMLYRSAVAGRGRNLSSKAQYSILITSKIEIMLLTIANDS